MDEPVVQDSAPTPCQSSLSTPAEKVTRSVSPTIDVTIDPEATRRFQGHEGVVQKVCALATEEAQARGLVLHYLDVRPAWSHEYDERTGVVVDAAVEASTDEQFSYWDAVGERLTQLEDTLPLEERSFLVKEISFVVSQN